MGRIVVCTESLTDIKLVSGPRRLSVADSSLEGDAGCLAEYSFAWTCLSYISLRLCVLFTLLDCTLSVPSHLYRLLILFIQTIKKPIYTWSTIGSHVHDTPDESTTLQPIVQSCKQTFTVWHLSITHSFSSVLSMKINEWYIICTYTHKKSTCTVSIYCQSCTHTWVFCVLETCLLLLHRPFVAA